MEFNETISFRVRGRKERFTFYKTAIEGTKSWLESNIIELTESNSIKKDGETEDIIKKLQECYKKYYSFYFDMDYDDVGRAVKKLVIEDGEAIPTKVSSQELDSTTSNSATESTLDNRIKVGSKRFAVCSDDNDRTTTTTTTTTAQPTPQSVILNNQYTNFSFATHINSTIAPKKVKREFQQINIDIDGLMVRGTKLFDDQYRVVYVDPLHDAVVQVFVGNPELARNNFNKEVSTLGSFDKYFFIADVFGIDARGTDGEPLKIIYEKCMSTLSDYLTNKNNAISEAKCLEWSTDIVEAMVHLHDQDIIHRNVNPDILFVTKDLGIVMLGFGSARTTTDPNMTTIGRIGFAPPQMEISSGKEKSNYSNKCDVFATGSVMFEIFHRSPICDKNMNINQQIKFHREIEQGIRPQISNSVPGPISRLITKCWKQNEDERPDFNLILSDLLSLTVDENGKINEIETIE